MSAFPDRAQDSTMNRPFVPRAALSKSALQQHGDRLTSDGTLLGHSLTIGTILETKVRLHWTFVIYLAAIGIVGLVAGGADAAISILVLVLAVFACVLAHEFGHILAARGFGIPTPEVILLPIGGVARLQRIPERVGEELAVAIAGPLVNFTIAGTLIAIFGVVPATVELASLPTISDILPDLVTINLFLGLFNLIPAFPMDGGRIFRAGLSLLTDRERATRIASAIGQALAIAFGFVGLVSGNFILIFIAVFVYLAAAAEVQDLKLRQLIGPLRVADVMMSELHPLRCTDTIHEAGQMVLRTGQHDFPVLDNAGQLIGVLSRDRLVRAFKAHSQDDLVSHVAESNWYQVSVDSPAKDALALVQGDALPIVAVDREGRLKGLLTTSNLIELHLLASLAEPDKQCLPKS